MRAPHLPQRSAGLALIAVLWITAALSLMVSGLVATLKGEIRATTAARQSTVAGAHAQAGIQLVLQRLAATSEKPIDRLMATDLSFNGTVVRVEWTSLNGLIDINHAQLPLLSAALRTAVPMDPGLAQQIGQAILDRRNQKDLRGQPIQFESKEDLLTVPGVDYDIYARLAPLITADHSGGGKVNPLLAPLGVLNVLTGGQADQALGIAQARAGGAVGIDTTGLSPEYTDNGTSTRLLLQATVPLSDGKMLVSTYGVDLQPNSQERLPWKIFSTERRIETPLSPSNFR